MPTHSHRKGGVANLVAHANQALSPQVMVSQIQQALNADVQSSQLHQSLPSRRRKLHKKKSKRAQASNTRRQSRVKS